MARRKRLVLIVAVVVLVSFAALLVALTDQDDELDGSPAPAATRTQILR